MARSTTARQEATYAKLLQLYPTSYRRQFAEPMQQMFVDLCHERTQNGLDTRGLAYRLYAETLMGALTQHLQETRMNLKTTQAKVTIGVGLIGIIAAIAILSNRPTAQLLHPGLGLKQVRQLSKGTKSACLADSSAAANAVKHDDTFQVYKGTKFSNFESAAGIAITDVPAGTNYHLAINSYANKTVTGTLAYEKDYGTYNYTIKKLPAAGQWQLMSIVACQKS